MSKSLDGIFSCYYLKLEVKKGGKNDYRRTA